MPNLNESLDNLGNFQTNKDQTLGEVIARAALLISQGAHLQKRAFDDRVALEEEEDDGCKQQSSRTE